MRTPLAKGSGIMNGDARHNGSLMTQRSSREFKTQIKKNTGRRRRLNTQDKDGPPEETTLQRKAIHMRDPDNEIRFHKSR